MTHQHLTCGCPAVGAHRPACPWTRHEEDDDAPDHAVARLCGMRRAPAAAPAGAANPVQCGLSAPAAPPPQPCWYAARPRLAQKELTP